MRMWLIVSILLLSLTPAYSHNSSHVWEKADPATQQWFSTLTQPDNPKLLCCGEADAYFCEAFVRKEKSFCRITDDRDDVPLNRMHVPPGTEIEIPNWKIKHDRGNPTGRDIVFLTPAAIVICFVFGSGI